MLPLHNTRILLGISGGIASYKTATLARRLIDVGAEVRVIMTSGAQSFITPLTLQALTGNPVHTDLLDPAAEAAMGHIELARWANLVVIAPASANVLARLANGLADDLLTTCCLATEAPMIVAPAMNRVMWSAAATQYNCNVLAERGVLFLGPDEGEQACGETGAGRMLEPEALRDAIVELVQSGKTPRLPEPQAMDSNLHQGTQVGNRPSTIHAGHDGDDTAAAASTSGTLAGKHVVLTAGPTIEPIDPVRFITNRSSGKMGYALADAARAAGARVTLISGPVALDTPAGVSRIDAHTAREMHEAVMSAVATADVFIGVAAVADYRVEAVADQKIKKSDDTLQLNLVRNPDILADVSARADRPFCVGFAAETESVEAFARGKLERKKLDMIAANHVGQKDQPVFGSDSNALSVYWGADGEHRIESAPKTEVATQLIQLIARQLDA